MKKWETFSEEELKSILSHSNTRYEAAKKLGYKPNAKTNKIIDFIANKYNIDISHYKITKFNTRKNLVGEKFGMLTVLRRDEERSKIARRSYWITQCDCENHTISSQEGTNLIRGLTRSCGCKKMFNRTQSNGERKIEEILINEKYKYIKEYSFIDLYDKSCLSPLRFDFAIFNKTGDLKYLLEYQGQQHFESFKFFGGEKGFEKIKKHDKMKEEYCNIHNIPLIKILYQEEKLLSSDFLKQKEASL